MSRKEVTSEQSPIVKMMTVGESVQGWLLRIRDGKYNEMYDFVDEDGKTFSVPHQSDLSQKLCRIPYKTFVEITLVEIKPLKGGNTYKEYKVVIDDELKFPE